MSIELDGTIRTQDAVLKINFHAHMAPPTGYSGWYELPCSEPCTALIDQPELGSRLRDVRLDVSAWKKALEVISYAIKFLTLSPGGRLHVFFNGPHPLALWVGQQLECKARQYPILLHQYDLKQKRWLPFVDLHTPSSARSDSFGDPQPLGIDRMGSGTVFSWDVVQHATAEQLESLRDRVGARQIQRFSSPAPGHVVDAGAPAGAALKKTLDALLRVRSQAPNEPIYLATSAPAALALGLGFQLRATVFPPVWACYYDAAAGEYLPFLEIFSGRIAEALRPRLEILQRGIGLLYRMNGELVEAVGDPLNGKDGIPDRRALLSSLQPAIARLSECVLPEDVEARTQLLPELDVELRVDGPAAELSWELLYLGRKVRDFALLRPGWTFTRMYTPARAPEEHRLLAPHALKVLIVPSLALNDPRCSAKDAEHQLQLQALVAQLEAHQVQVRCLRYGCSLEEVQDALTRSQPHILHWIGHGMPDRADWPPVLELSDTGGLNTLDRTQLPHFIRLAGKSLRLLVLNACSAVGPSNGYGVPGLLLEHGLPAVIGYRDPVGMKELQWFAQPFYAHLLEGKSIRDAVAEARVDIHRKFSICAAFAAPIVCASSSQAVGPLVSSAQRP